MRSLVDFEILTSSEDFAACRERTRKRLLSRVYTNMVHQLKNQNNILVSQSVKQSSISIKIMQCECELQGVIASRDTLM